MIKIAILPTGDWAEVESDNDVQFVTLTDLQYQALNSGIYSDNTILRLDSSCTKENIDVILNLEGL